MENQIKKLKQELNEVEEMIFLLEMKDNWTEKEFAKSRELEAKAKKIREELEKCKKNN